MKKIFYKILILFISATFSISNCYATTQPSPKAPVINLENELYKRAEIELNQNFYQLYRITERISRANKLNENSWRVAIPARSKIKYDENKNDFNAYTKDANAIVILPGISDAFYGDVSILAFLVAHEMAHQTLGHISKIARNQEEIDQKTEDLKKPVTIQVDNIVQDSLLINTAVKHIAPYYLYIKEKQLKEQLNNDYKELYLDYQGENRKMEYEADKLGLIYMTKAGFDPKASLRLFELFKRCPEISEVKSDHPLSSNRKFYLETQLKSINIKLLKAQGISNIKNSKPLPFDKTQDEQAIIIHSKYSLYETPSQPFEKLFGR